jgi:5-methylcytosine-specific restriction endonuclease McrA
MVERLANPEYRNRLLAGIKKRTATKSWQVNHRKALRKVVASDSWKRNKAEASRRLAGSREWRAKMRETNPCWQRGKNNTNWKGGYRNARQMDRQRSENKQFVKSVLERDGYCCTKCGARNDLHVHHVKGWAGHPELRYVAENGITVCCSCHGEIHGRRLAPRSSKTGRRKKIASQQFALFS